MMPWPQRRQQIWMIGESKEHPKGRHLDGHAKQKIWSIRYKVSKLLLLYAVRSIAAKSPVSPKSNVVINYLTPGACKSDIFRDEASWLQRLIMTIGIAMFARTTEAGSRTFVHAVQPDVGKDTHGAFLMDCKVAE